MVASNYQSLPTVATGNAIDSLISILDPVLTSDDVVILRPIGRLEGYRACDDTMAVRYEVDERDLDEYDGLFFGISYLTQSVIP